METLMMKAGIAIMTNVSEKQRAGQAAAEYVKSGMTVGLGTGSTVRHTIEKLADRMRTEGLAFRGIPTSTETADLAKSLGISLVTFKDIETIDLTIDGADEIGPGLNGIKGGGGALLLEKIVAFASNRTIWVADSSKMVEHLGKFPLPVEVIPFATPMLFREFEKTNMNPVIRQIKGEEIVTDSGNWIIDLHLEKIDDPTVLEMQLNLMPGVVENGLFLNRTDLALIAETDKVHTYERHV